MNIIELAYHGLAEWREQHSAPPRFIVVSRFMYGVLKDEHKALKPYLISLEDEPEPEKLWGVPILIQESAPLCGFDFK